ncbi:MAG: hypothetical protein ACRDOU_22520 [Streptosporangiaceae bacterium]
MSIKSKVLATVATLATVGGVGTAGVLGTAMAATAATTACGPTCIDIFSQEFGNHTTPNYILDVQGQGRIGQPVILYSVSVSNPGEDFRLALDGTVADLYAAKMVTAALALHYGCIPGVNFPDCFGQTKYAVNDPAFEIEYTPGGMYGGLCVGVASTAVQGEGVTLQECGSSKTVWVVDQYDQPVDFFFHGYAPAINGSDTNFSQPFVLTYPPRGVPTGMPSPQLQVDNLSGYTTGFPPVLNYPSIDINQLWGADYGAI